MKKRPRLRRAFAVVVAFVLLVVALYVYLTRPAALRAALVDTLGDLGLRVTRMGDVSLSPSGALTIHDLELRTESTSQLALKGTDGRNIPPLLRVPAARVRLRLSSLLRGKCEPQSVVIKDPTISVIWQPGGERDEPGFMGQGCGLASRAGDGHLPHIRLIDADVQVLTVQDGRLHLRQRLRISGEGSPRNNEGDAAPSYVLRLDQVGGPALSAQADAGSLAEIELTRGRMRAELGWVDLQLVQDLLPTEVRDELANVALGGRVRVRQLTCADGSLATLGIEFENLAGALPVEEAELEPDRRFAQLRHGRLNIAYAHQAAANTDPGQLSVEFEGAINDAAVHLKLAAADVHFGQGTGEEDAGILAGVTVGPYRAEASIAGLTIPTHESQPDFVTSPRLPAPLRGWIRRYNADGRVELEATVEGESWCADAKQRPQPRYVGRLNVLDGSCAYDDFPYRIGTARGAVRFDNDGVYYDGLSGSHGTDRIRLDGALDSTKSYTGFDLRFTGTNIVANADLYAALPGRYQRLWDRVTPIGLWDVNVHLTREDGSEEHGSCPTHIAIDGRLLSGSLDLLDGQRLERASGRVRIAGNTITLDELHGYLGDASVQISGTLTIADEGARIERDLRVEAAGVRLQRESIVRDGNNEPMGTLQFDGTGDIWAQLRNEDNGGSQYVLRITDGELRGFEGSEMWRAADGLVLVHNDYQEIKSLKLRSDDGALALSGKVPANVGMNSPIELDMNANDGDVAHLLRELVPPRWAGLREALGLDGAGKIHAHFEAAEGEGPPQQQATVEIAAERMKPKPLPLDLENIEAAVTLHADGFDVENAEAHYQENGHIAVRGHGGWSNGAMWTDAQVDAHSMMLDATFIDALPPQLADVLRPLAPNGTMNLNLDRFNISGTDELNWDVNGTVWLRDASLDIGAPLRACDGLLRGQCHIRPHEPTELAAEFEIERGELMQRSITQCEGKLVYSSDAQKILIEELRGAVGGGRAFGFAQIDLDKHTYALSLTLNDVSQDSLFVREKPAASAPAKTSEARVDGHAFLEGDMRDPMRRRGGGELRVRNTSLKATPVTASVASAQEKSRRSFSDRVDQAEVQFVWEGDVLRFNRVDIMAKDQRLLGCGTWNTRTDQIEMTLAGATQDGALRLPIVTELLEGARDELMQYRITGTYSQPQVSVEPLHNLTGPIKELLEGEAGK